VLTVWLDGARGRLGWPSMRLDCPNLGLLDVEAGRADQSKDAGIIRFDAWNKN
jgi:hypothetical protein